MEQIFKNQGQGRVVLGALPDNDYDETVWENWEVLSEVELDQSCISSPVGFPVELRVEPGLENADVEDGLRFAVNNNGLHAHHVGLQRVYSSDGAESWKVHTSDIERFALMADSGQVMIAITFSPEVAPEHRIFATNAIIDSLK